MTAFTTNGAGGGAFNVGASYAGAPGVTPTNGNSDTVTILAGDTLTVNSGAEGCLSVLVNNGGTFVIDCTAAPQTFTWDDAANAGFNPGTESGTINLTGTAVNPCTIESAGGPEPTNWWLGGINDGTWSYATLSGYWNVNFVGTLSVDNCIFMGNKPAVSFTVRLKIGCTITSFTHNTIDSGYGDSLVIQVTHTAFDTIQIIAPWGIDIYQSNATRSEFVDSTFNEANCDTNVTGIIVSKDHCAAGGDYYIIMADGDTVSFNEFTNEPDAGDDVYLYVESGGDGATFQFNEAAKRIGNLTCQEGKTFTINVTANVAWSGDCTNLYIVTITGATLTVDASTQGNVVTWEFIVLNGCQLNLGANSELALEGTMDYQITIKETGTDKYDAPTYGIAFDAANPATLDMDWAALYHVKAAPTMATFTLEMNYSAFWFVVATSPWKWSDSSGTLSLSDSRIAAYDNQEWYFTPTQTFNNIDKCQFDGHLLTIYSTTDGIFIVFLQGVTELRTVLPTLVEDDVNYQGGENVVIERTHDTRYLLKVEGRFTYHGTSVAWGFGTDLVRFTTPLENKYPLEALKTIYMARRTNLIVLYHEGGFPECTIDELKYWTNPGASYFANEREFSMVIKGEEMME